MDQQKFDSVAKDIFHQIAQSSASIDLNSPEAEQYPDYFAAAKAQGMRDVRFLTEDIGTLNQKFAGILEGQKLSALEKAQVLKGMDGKFFGATTTDDGKTYLTSAAGAQSYEHLMAIGRQDLAGSNEAVAQIRETLAHEQKVRENPSLTYEAIVDLSRKEVGEQRAVTDSSGKVIPGTAVAVDREIFSGLFSPAMDVSDIRQQSLGIIDANLNHGSGTDLERRDQLSGLLSDVFKFEMAQSEFHDNGASGVDARRALEVTRSKVSLLSEGYQNYQPDPAIARDLATINAQLAGLYPQLPASSGPAASSPMKVEANDFGDLAALKGQMQQPGGIPPSGPEVSSPLRKIVEIKVPDLTSSFSPAGITPKDKDPPVLSPIVSPVSPQIVPFSSSPTILPGLVLNTKNGSSPIASYVTQLAGMNNAASSSSPVAAGVDDGQLAEISGGTYEGAFSPKVPMPSPALLELKPLRLYTSGGASYLSIPRGTPPVNGGFAAEWSTTTSDTLSQETGALPAKIVPQLSPTFSTDKTLPLSTATLPENILKLAPVNLPALPSIAPVVSSPMVKAPVSSPMSTDRLLDLLTLNNPPLVAVSPDIVATSEARKVHVEGL